MNYKFRKIDITTVIGTLLFLFYANFLVPFASYKLLSYLIVIALLALFFTQRFTVLNCLKREDVQLFYATPILLFALGLIPIESISTGKKSLQNIFYFIAIFLALILFLEGSRKVVLKNFETLICCTLIIAVAYHLFACLTVNSTQSFFSNPHYAAQFALTAFFILTYLLLKRRNYTSYLIWFFCSLACGWILVNTLSRPAWIALVVSVGLTLITFYQRRTALIGILVITVVSILLYLILPDFFSNRVDDLIHNIKTEERVQIWSDAIKMQVSSNIGYWLIGHGPGSYELFFRDYNNFHNETLFPHNFLLEILFESGAIGVLLVTLFYQRVFATILKSSKVDDPYRSLSVLLFLCMSVNLALSSVTVPFYSKYVLLYQTPFITIALYLSRKQHSGQPASG